MERPTKKRGLQTKVLLGFSIALVAVAIAAIIGFTSLTRLVASIETLSSPDQKIIYLKKLLNDLSDEENSVRTYALTKNESYLKEYLRISDSVHKKILQLKAPEGNDPQPSVTDSLARLVAERETVFDLFIEERKADTPLQVNNVPEVKKDMPLVLADSQKTSVVAAIRADTPAISKPKKNPGFFSRLFGSSDKNKKDKNEEVKTAVPSPSITEKKDSFLTSPIVALSETDVKHLLKQKEAELNKQLEGWTSEELLLLQQDKYIMDKIRSQINLLEVNEENIVKDHADEANRVADNASLIISVIGALGILSTFIFLYLILIDIGKNNRLKKQLIQARQQAENLARVKEEFLANMSHEIRTPLNSIIGFTEQLSKQKINPSHDRFIRAIQHSSDHLISIVNQILDFSKMEAGKFSGEDAHINFEELLKQVMEIFEMKAAEKNITLSYSVENNMPDYVSGDAVSMKQILINLVSNAIKFTNNGSIKINSSVTSEEDGIYKIRTEVTDTGIGIPLSMQENIFSAFTQADTDIARKYSGTGLGLAITKKLCDLLGGEIELSSKESEGSSFVVTIPFKHADSPGLKIMERSFEHDGLLAGRCVLIADDEQMNVMLTQTILHGWGVKTEVAYSGQEALDKLNTHPFDLVLLDIQMPGMSGIEVAEKIRSLDDAKKREVPLIALTANVFTDSLKNKDSFFNEVLLKPFKEETLLAKIKEVLNGKGKNDKTDGACDDLAESGDVEQLFNLKYLKKISGANKEFELQMLRLFIQNNKTHIQQLTAALNEKDWDRIHRLAHKMVPQFRYLQIQQTEEKLKLLESLTADKKHMEKVPSLVQEICLFTERVISLIEEEVRKSTVENPLQPEALSNEFANHPIP